MKARDLLSIDDLTVGELAELIASARAIKKGPDAWTSELSGKQVALIFEKPSTRTRVSFETAVTSMGGHAVVLRGDELQLGRGETIEDTGRVLSRYVDAIVVRTFGQDRLERLADAASVPVVNALSDYEHPCQCLADLQTIEEKFGDLKDRILTYLGDGNNVAHSLLLGGVKAGMEVRVACPDQYRPLPQVVERARDIGTETGGRAVITSDARQAVEAADILYTDVWASMGQESEAKERSSVFEPYRIDADLVAGASKEAIVMHCLPAHRGEEISADVMDGPRAVVWDQAENRMHAQKALLAFLLE